MEQKKGCACGVGYTWVPSLVSSAGSADGCQPSLVSSAGSADGCRRPHSPQKGPRRAAPQSMQKFRPGGGADGWPLLKGLALALPDGVAALVAVLTEAIAADLRVRLVALAFFVHAPEARRHGIVVQGCPQGCEGGEH